MVWSPLSKLQLSTVVEPLSWVEAVALRLTAHNLWVLTEGETCLCVIQSHRHSHPQLPQSIVWLYESAENATPVGFVESSPICFFVFFFLSSSCNMCACIYTRVEYFAKNAFEMSAQLQTTRGKRVDETTVTSIIVP